MFLINPFLSPAGGDFESIATVTVGSGGAANIEFTSIPGTYQHLQIRGINRSSQSIASVATTSIQFNSDSSSNYARHQFGGYGTGTFAAGQANQTTAWAGTFTSASHLSNVFGATVIDILDYANTSKNTTVRAHSGADINGGEGYYQACSGLWLNTSAVSSIKLIAGSGFAQHSTFALYGVKAP